MCRRADSLPANSLHKNTPTFQNAEQLTQVVSTLMWINLNFLFSLFWLFIHNKMAFSIAEKENFRKETMYS